MTKFLPSALAVTLLLSSSANSATLTAYTDRTAFENAISAEVTQDFNGFASDQSFGGGSFDVGDFSLNADSTSATNKIDALPLDGGLGSVDGTALARFFLNNSTVGITFDTGIYAFGFDQYAFGNGTNVSSMTILGSSFLSDLSGAASEAGFFGVVSDMAFTQIDFASSINDGFALDNLTYTTAPSAVPLPAAGWMLLASLGGLAAMRRRKRS